MKAAGTTKRLLTSLSILLLIFTANLKSATAVPGDPDYYYYSGGRKIQLPVSGDKLAIRFKPEITIEQQRAILRSEENLSPSYEAEQVAIFGVTVLPMRENLLREDVIQTIERLNRESEVEFSSAVFDLADANLVVTDEFNAKFVPSVSQREIDSFNALHNVEIIEGPSSSGCYTLRVKDARNMNTLNIANLYYESPITEFAMPNFIIGSEKLLTVVDDTYFDNQWALDNYGQSGGAPGADMNAPGGWDITTGSSDTVIAILDTGVDLGHEDLANKLVDGYDAVGEPPDYDPSPGDYSGEAHGTACAGLAAAETNNATGVAGVCPDCKIMPIRVRKRKGNGWWWTVNTTRAAIEWAANNGADVLSNSWEDVDSDTIHNAIIYAKDNGRDEKGCVIVFASGNNFAGVVYPAKYPEVIAVGATDHNDVKWDYSSFGPGLDVVAPSAKENSGVVFWTTDISGPNGYNNRDESKGDPNGNYTKWFNGTSAAAPQVAGLAALILSVDPNLTSDEVGWLIRNSSDDKGPPGWDIYYGAGRVNIYNAVYYMSYAPSQATNPFPPDDATGLSVNPTSRIGLSFGFFLGSNRRFRG